MIVQFSFMPASQVSSISWNMATVACVLGLDAVEGLVTCQELKLEMMVKQYRAVN